MQYHKRSGKWIALITFKGKTYNLGKYDKIEEAARARRMAEERIFGEFLEWYYENFPAKRTRKRSVEKRIEKLPKPYDTEAPRREHPQRMVRTAAGSQE